MEQNIKTKDVQRTEYLDKNGLDVLWAKVKENTNNQVEVERNRAVAKENSITNSLGQFVSKTATDEQFLESRLTAYSGFYVKSRVNGDYSGASLYIENRTKPCLNMIDFGQSITSELTPSKLKLAYDGDRSITITRDGITNPDNNSNHVFATDGSIADLAKYIKIDDAYEGCIPYYNKYTEREIQLYQLADREGIELSSFGTSTKLIGTDIAISSGSEDLTINQSGISINSYGGESNHFYLDVNSSPELNLYDDKCNISAKIFSDGYARIGIRNHNYGQSTYDLELSSDGIEMLSKTTKDIVTANNSTAHIGLDDDQTEYTYVAPLEMVRSQQNTQTCHSMY